MDPELSLLASLLAFFLKTKRSDKGKYEESCKTHFLRQSSDVCKTLLLYFSIWRWGMRRKGRSVVLRQKIHISSQ